MSLGIHSIVLELTGLLALNYLELTSIIGKGYSKWYCARSLLDELTIAIENLRIFGVDAARYMSWEDGS